MKENMGQIIKRLRKERNLTQEELAEQLNISAQAVSKWENGTSMPDISQVVPLANLYMRKGKLDDALYCYTFLRSMADALYTEEKYRPTFIYDYYPMYRFPAECLVRLGREEEAIDLLEEGVKFIIAQAESINKKRNLDVPLLRDHSFGYGNDGNAKYGDLKGRLQRFISGDVFAPLQQNPRYKALTEQIMAIR